MYRSDTDLFNAACQTCGRGWPRANHHQAPLTESHRGHHWSSRLRSYGELPEEQLLAARLPEESSDAHSSSVVRPEDGAFPKDESRPLLDSLDATYFAPTNADARRDARRSSTDTPCSFCRSSDASFTRQHRRRRTPASRPAWQLGRATNLVEQQRAWRISVLRGPPGARRPLHGGHQLALPIASGS